MTPLGGAYPYRYFGEVTPPRIKTPPPGSRGTRVLNLVISEQVETSYIVSYLCCNQAWRNYIMECTMFSAITGLAYPLKFLSNEEQFGLHGNEGFTEVSFPVNNSTNLILPVPKRVVQYTHSESD